MKSATQKARAMLAKLEALASAGVEGERTAAQKKVDRLRAAFDFAAAPEFNERDIFADLVFEYDDEARNVATLGAADCDLAPFVAWALGGGLRIQTTLRGGRDWQTHVAAHVPLGSLAHVSRLAEHLAGSFRAAWARALASGALRPQDRTLFLRGLLDGCTNDERQSGELLRNASAPKKAPRAGRRAVSSSCAAIHPYTLALDIGRRIRLSAPEAEICEAIDSQTRGAIAA